MSIRQTWIRRAGRRGARWVAMVLAAALSGTVLAQESPVYVDHSPRAWELFRRALDQQADNPGETVRLFQELLDDYPLQLAPINDAAPDHLTTFRQRIHRVLSQDAVLLDRYRTIATPQARRLLDVGDVDRLVRSRALTEPGLDGLLHLAQDALEDGRFHVASSYLDEASRHPLLTQDAAAHCWSMFGAAACFLNDDSGIDDARTHLVAIGRAAEPFVAALDSLVSEIRRPRSTVGTSSLDSGAQASLNDLVAEAIWSLDLQHGSLVTRSIPSVTDTPATPGRRQTADRLATTVTVAGDRAYVNDGHTLICLDRFTGNRIWLRPFTDRLLRTRGGAESRPRDLNVVSVAGDWLVTLSGHAEDKDRTGDGRIVCLNASTGETRWTQVLDGIGMEEDHEDLFPYGTPLIADRTVYLLGRKVSDQSLTSCYVIALELASGELRWARHIASSGAIRRTSRPFSTLVHDRGQLFVATNVGAVCRLDAATGRTQWLRRYQVPIHFADQDMRGCDLPGPIVTRRGVVALQQDGRRLRTILFDRETGDELESYDAGTLDGWAAPRYLLANEHSVYAIGSEIRAFRIENLSHPVWELPARRARSSVDGPRRETTEPLRIVGRVQLTEEALVVPSRSGIRMLDPESGVEMHRLPINGVGNPLAIDSQLFMASTEHLDAYMSYTNAERMLRRRIGEHPDDPDVALSLLRLGMRVENLDLVLEAADLVLSASSATRSIEVSEIARRTLLELLLQVAEQKLAGSNDDGELLYAMLGAAATTPEQRVRFQLAYGDWLEQVALDRAVECYQTILSDPMLAGAEYMTGTTVRSARDLAIGRLGTIITRHGSDVYAPQADFAQMELETIMAAPGGDAMPLIDLIRQFPFAPSAIEAALLAADHAADTGDHRTAVHALAVASEQAGTPADASRLLSRLIETCALYGWDRAAHAIVARVQNRMPALTLEIDGGIILAREWLARPRLEQHAADDLPAIGISPDREATRKVAGPMLMPEPGSETPPTDRLLTLDETRLTMHDASLNPIWTVEIESDSPQLLRFTPTDVLLWFGNDLRDPRAVMLNATDGSHRWTTAELGDHLDDSVQQLAQLRDQNQTMPNGRVFDPRETMALVHGDSLVVIQRTGGVVAFDLLDGELEWAAPRTIDQVHVVTMHDFGLALAGARLKRDAIAGRTAALPVITVLDLERDGAERWRIHPHANDAESGPGVRWMVATDTGSLVYGTDEGIEAFDLLAGARQWSNLGPAATGADRAWPMANVVVIDDRTRQLRTIALADGEVSRPFETSSVGGDWDPQDLRSLFVDGDQAVALFRQRVIRYHGDGSVLGADAIIDTRLYQYLVPVREALVLVSMYKREQVVSDDGLAETERTYRVYTLAPSGKLLNLVPMAIPRKPVRQAAVIDGWILLSTAFNTYAVSMPSVE